MKSTAIRLLKATQEHQKGHRRHLLIVIFKSRVQSFAPASGAQRLRDEGSVLVISVNAGRPMDLLQKSIGAQVLVELRGKRKLRGRLRGYDQHLNLILEDADEMSFDDEAEHEIIEVIKTVIVRGDNVVLVSPPPESARE